MSVSPESGVYFRYAQKYISGRANIARGLEEARKDPEIIQEAVRGIDEAVTSLNRFNRAPHEVAQSQRVLLPNALAVREVFERYGIIYPFPTAAELANNRSPDVIWSGMSVFEDANEFMQRGETRRTRREAWRFHKTVKDPGQLADALGLELYRLFSYPQLAGDNYKLMLALEEMLAVHYQETRMFRSVKNWYTTEKGFSPLLVVMVKGEVGIPFQEGQIFRQTPNFRVVDGYKPDLEGQLEGQSFIIEPLSDEGERMLLSAAVAHNIHHNIYPRTIEILGRQAIGLTLQVDRISDNVRVLLGGYAGGLIPSPDRMEEILRLQRPFYTFTD